MVVDHVYLRVSPTRGVQCFGVKGKLAPRYVGPYEIIEECGPAAYRLRLPSRLAAIHNVFHISQLKKCVRVPTEIIDQQEILVDPISHIPNIHSEFWIKKREVLAERW